jgi:ABC-type multidrug transport system fused ATPase/permease subunit
MSILSLCQKSMSLLNSRHRKIFVLAIFTQFIINLSDVVALGLITVIGSLASNYVIGSEPESWIVTLLDILNLNNYSVESLIASSLSIVVVLFIFKSIFTSFSMLKIMKFLAKRQAEVSIDLIGKITSSKYSWLKKQNSQKLIYTATDGVHSVITGVLGSLASFISDLTLFAMIVSIIFIIDFETAIFILVFFSLVLYVSGRYTQNLSMKFGSKITETSVTTRNTLTSLLNSVREITLTGNQKFFTKNLDLNLTLNSEAKGMSTWVQQLPKSIYEIALVIGAFILLLFQIKNNDFSEALTLMLVFLVASGRLIPALMRMQTSIILIRGYQAGSEIVIELIDELSKDQSFEIYVPRQFDLISAPAVKFDSVSYSFEGQSAPAVHNFSFEIAPGQLVALVGPTGSGKTTLIDLMLGFYKPDSGSINFKTKDSIAKPESIKNVAYVPQMPVLVAGSIRDNIIFGDIKEDIDSNKLNSVIRNSGLDLVIKKLPNGINTLLDQIGNSVSGGELQRISIARALYLESKFIVLDEATSALDGTMEKNITDHLNTLKEFATIVIVAHRLSSIKTADTVIYLDKGEIAGTGTFLELQNNLPNFAKAVSDMRI